MLELLEYLVLGIGVGTVGALLGLGGGFILVPIFMLFMIAPHGSTFTTVQQVVGTSLFAVFCNAISGTFAYIRQRRILMRAAVPFALATLPGAFLGGYLSEWFSGPGFSLAFGILMVFIGYIMYSKSRGKAANKSVEDWDPATARFNMPLGILCSFFVGFLSCSCSHDVFRPWVPAADCGCDIHLRAFRERCYGGFESRAARAHYLGTGLDDWRRCCHRCSTWCQNRQKE